MDVETPDVVRVALQSGGPAILLGLHFGAIELPTVFMAHHLGRPVTAPMETVSDPAVARWFRESRSRVGRRPRPGRQRAARPARRAAAGRLRGPRQRPRPDGWRAPRPVLRGTRADPAGRRPPRDRDRRADVRGRLPAHVRRPVRGQAGPRPGAGRGHAPRADDRAHGPDRRHVRDDHRGRPGAVVGRLPPDLAGPRGGQRRRSRRAG